MFRSKNPYGLPQIPGSGQQNPYEPRKNKEKRVRNPYGLPQNYTDQRKNPYGVPPEYQAQPFAQPAREIPQDQAYEPPKPQAYESPGRQAYEPPKPQAFDSSQRQPYAPPRRRARVGFLLSIALLIIGLASGLITNIHDRTVKPYPDSTALQATTDYWKDLKPASGGADDTVLAKQIAVYYRNPDYLTEDRQAINKIRTGHLDGYPEYTIEEVMLSLVRGGDVGWRYVDNQNGKFSDSAAGYVEASGSTADSGYLYCSFDMNADGTFNLRYFSVGDRNEAEADALALYGEEYKKIPKHDPVWEDEKARVDYQWAAIDLVRGSTLTGFPDHTIGDVLLSGVDENGLDWNFIIYKGGASPRFSVDAFGNNNKNFIGAGIDAYDNGTLKLISLYSYDSDGNTDFSKKPMDTYAEWYSRL